MTLTSKKYLSFFILLLLLFHYSKAAVATRQITNQVLTWTRLTNTLQIDSHWAIYTEADNRVLDNPPKENQVVLRLMARYTFKSGITIGAGYVSVFNFPNDPNFKSNLMIPELRPSVDVTFRQLLKKVTLYHRSVLENRFTCNASSTELKPGFTYTFRYRYRLQADFLLWKNNSSSVKFVLSDELIFQMGKTIVYNVFDQNRIYAAFNYEPLKWLGFEAGYLHLFQQRNTGVDFYSRHVFRFSIHTKIFLKHKY